MMRTATLILLTGVTMMLLGCGLFDSGQEAQEGGTAPAEFETPAGTVAPHASNGHRDAAGGNGDAHGHRDAAAGV